MFIVCGVRQRCAFAASAMHGVHAVMQVMQVMQAAGVHVHRFGGAGVMMFIACCRWCVAVRPISLRLVSCRACVHNVVRRRLGAPWVMGYLPPAPCASCASVHVVHGPLLNWAPIIVQACVSWLQESGPTISCVVILGCSKHPLARLAAAQPRNSMCLLAGIRATLSARRDATRAGAGRAAQCLGGMATATIRVAGTAEKEMATALDHHRR